MHLDFERLWNDRDSAVPHGSPLDTLPCAESLTFQAMLDTYFDRELPHATIPRVEQMKLEVDTLLRRLRERLDADKHTYPHECIDVVRDRAQQTLDGFLRALLLRKPKRTRRPSPPPPRSVGGVIIGEILGRLIEDSTE